jgi:hypothetical protein
LFGQGGEVGVGGQHVGGWKIAAGQSGRAGWFGPALDPCLALGLFLTVAGSGGIGGQHRPVSGAAQLPGGLTWGGAEHRPLNGGGVLVGEPGEFLSDHYGPGHVDVSGGQGRAGHRQAAQADRQIKQLVGRPCRQRQSDRDLVSGEFAGSGVACCLFVHATTPEVASGG